MTIRTDENGTVRVSKWWTSLFMTMAVFLGALIIRRELWVGSMESRMITIERGIERHINGPPHTAAQIEINRVADKITAIDERLRKIEKP